MSHINKAKLEKHIKQIEELSRENPPNSFYHMGYVLDVILDCLEEDNICEWSANLISNKLKSCGSCGYLFTETGRLGFEDTKTGEVFFACNHDKKQEPADLPTVATGNCATCTPEKYAHYWGGETVPICEKHYAEHTQDSRGIFCENCVQHAKDTVTTATTNPTL